MKKMGKKFAYCSQCGKPAKKPKRKSLTSFHYQILIISALATFGIALIAFLIYRFFIQKKIYCPRCGEKVKFYRSPNEYPKKVPVINLMEKLEEEKSNKEEKNQEIPSTEKKQYKKCENCGQDIDMKADICPYCGWEQGTKEIEIP